MVKCTKYSFTNFFDLMWFYFLLLVFSVLLFNNNQIVKSPTFSIHSTIFATTNVAKVSILVVLVYIIVRTFAYDTGADYLVYYNHYKNTASGRLDIWGEGRDYFYQQFILFLSAIFSPPQALFCICSILGVTSLILVSKQYGKAMPWIYLAWFIFMFNLSMNIYRQYIAMAFLMLALYMWNIKIRKIYIIVVLIIAFLFHKSALIGILLLLILYYVAKYRISKWLLIGLVIVTNIAALTILRDLLITYGIYLDLYMDSFGASYYADTMLDSFYEDSTMGYVNMINAIIVIFYSDKVMNGNKHLRWLFYILVFNFILEPITRQEILLRMRLYFTNFMIIGYGYCLYSNFRKHSLAYNFPLIIAFLLQFAYYYFYSLQNLINEYPLQFRYG